MVSALKKLEFPGHSGATLAARLDMPNGHVRAYALFAHCFTCSKDILAARRIAAELARIGIAVLRFDFTGLGSSAGEFASTNFTSNVGDLVSAADYMRANYVAPSILIGHSLGGAAVLSAAGDIPEVKGVVTIGAPSDTEHVIRNFGTSIDQIETDGQATLKLAGREFVVRRQFLDDVRQTRLLDAVAKLARPLLILHAPLDDVVGIENASKLFQSARHPKSFISLDQADHMLTNARDAEFAASVIAGWASGYIESDTPQGKDPVEHVQVMETGGSKFQNAVQAGRHRLFADEPASVGGQDSGPSPYDFLSIALGACTSMTIRIYAEFKKLDLGRITVDVSHNKVHVRDCEECTQEERAKGGKIDQFDRVISVDGALSDDLREKLAEIAAKCPVHRTLEQVSKVNTIVRKSE